MRAFSFELERRPSRSSISTVRQARCSRRGHQVLGEAGVDVEYVFDRWDGATDLTLRALRKAVRAA
jgi:hypothetical protein